MPYVSKAQQRFMHARHPKIAKRWDAHTPSFASLPERAVGSKKSAAKKKSLGSRRSMGSRRSR